MSQDEGPVDWNPRFGSGAGGIFGPGVASDPELLDAMVEDRGDRTGGAQDELIVQREKARRRASMLLVERFTDEWPEAIEWAKRRARSRAFEMMGVPEFESEGPPPWTPMAWSAVDTTAQARRVTFGRATEIVFDRVVERAIGGATRLLGRVLYETYAHHEIAGAEGQRRLEGVSQKEAAGAWATEKVEAFMELGRSLGPGKGRGRIRTVFGVGFRAWQASARTFHRCIGLATSAGTGPIHGGSARPFQVRATGSVRWSGASRCSISTATAVHTPTGTTTACHCAASAATRGSDRRLRRPRGFRWFGPNRAARRSLRRATAGCAVPDTRFNRAVWDCLRGAWPRPTSRRQRRPPGPVARCRSRSTSASRSLGSACSGC